MDGIIKGISAERTITVDEERTARHFGSGTVEVYATPAMINLMEASALAAIEDFLEDGQTSVGVSFEVRHLAATPIGQKVRAQAVVLDVSGRKITFKVQAWDEYELIGEGVHGRVIVDKKKFFERIKFKSPES